MLLAAVSLNPNDVVIEPHRHGVAGARGYIGTLSALGGRDKHEALVDHQRERHIGSRLGDGQLGNAVRQRGDFTPGFGVGEAFLSDAKPVVSTVAVFPRLGFSVVDTG